MIRRLSVALTYACLSLSAGVATAATPTPAPAPRASAPARAPAKAPARTKAGAAASSALLGPARYDEAAREVVVPYRGVLRGFSSHQSYRNNFSVYHFDFPGARAVGGVQKGKGDGPLYRFYMANRPDGAARLAVLLHRPGKMPVVTVDKVNRVIYLRFDAGAASGTRPSPGPSATPSPQAVRSRPVSTPSPAAGAETPLPRLVAPTPRPTPSPSPLPVVTRFSGAFFDSRQHSLLLPYAGQAPSFHLVNAEPRTVHVDFPGSAFGAAKQFGQALEGNMLLHRWEAKPLPGAGVVRLTLSLTHPAEVLVANDAERREIRVFPQLIGPLEAAREPRQGALKTLFGYATFDADTGAVAIAYLGQRPAHTIERIGESYLNVSFLDAAIDPPGIQYDMARRTPLLGFWLLAKRASESVTRLTLSLPYGGYVTVTDDPARKRLLVTPQLGEAP